jgi:hypothetical protein
VGQPSFFIKLFDQLLRLNGGRDFLMQLTKDEIPRILHNTIVRRQ